MLMLFLPKILGLLVAAGNPAEARAFGGIRRMGVSALCETAVSALLAPIAMLFNTKFVVFTLLGQGVSWVTQNRGANDGTDWREAILTHGEQTLFGIIWGVSSFVLLPSFFWWLSPVLAGLVFAIPLSIALSKVGYGDAAKRLGLFLTPEEVVETDLLRKLRRNLAECYQHLQPLESLRADYGLMQAVVDPYVNAVHISLLRQRRPSEESRDYFFQLRQRLLREGPIKLTSKEKMSLLLDAESMIWLHEELWRRPASALDTWWRLAVRQYNVLTAAPITALYR